MNLKASKSCFKNKYESKFYVTIGFEQKQLVVRDFKGGGA